MDEEPTAAPKLSRQEWARQQRRAAYLRAKEHRAHDPKQLAFKEAVKQRQREVYQAGKEQRKLAAKQEKARRSQRRDSRQAAQKQQLLMTVVRST